MFVLVTESMLQIVLVLWDTSMMVLIQTVLLVLIDVLLVLLATNVLLVLPEELTLHLVIAHLVLLNNVLLLVINFVFDASIAGADDAIESGSLEKCRSYVVGTAHQEGSGYPETWIDQPYSSNHGVTQIWKTSMAMTNTARATSLKYESSKWGRVWREKLIEHKWDIETSLLFGAQLFTPDTAPFTGFILQRSGTCRIGHCH
jgi:hypothetical protein